MIIPKKNRHEICKSLFQEGVLFAKKDYNLAKHPIVDVPNLQVIKLMQSFKSKEYVRETFAWEHYYWYLTNDGIEHLRTYLNLPSEIVPATLKKSARPPSRPFGSGPPGDRPRGPPRFEGDRPRFGDRDGYRGGPRGGQGDLEVTRVALHQSFNHHSEVLVVGPDLDAVVVDLVPVLYPLWNSLVLNSAWQKKKKDYA
ncbi:putative 40S ribosomal protein S10 [Iris pallida]|uniref:40S ribosomal protein S10 n=1 Tax=Iris pallida TaxID=29817 RepID=A0AAX6HNQ3_IRIPA|nr:putative 40S ribosomal protein S10 [Iris pallida]